MEKKVLQLYLEGNNYTSIAHMLGKSDKSIDNALSPYQTKAKKKVGEACYGVFKNR